MSKIDEAFSAFDALFRDLSDRIQTLEKKAQADNKQRFDFRIEKEAINAHINRVQADTERAIGELQWSLDTSKNISNKTVTKLQNLTNRVDRMEDKAEKPKDPQQTTLVTSSLKKHDPLLLFRWDTDFMSTDTKQPKGIKVISVTTSSGNPIPRIRLNIVNWRRWVGPTCLVFGIRDDGKPVAMRWKSLCDHYDLVMS